MFTVTHLVEMSSAHFTTEAIILPSAKYWTAPILIPMAFLSYFLGPSHIIDVRRL